MNDVFGSGYASAYDALYADKDYRGECAVLEDVWARHGGNVRTVLDLGCGTGSHAHELASRGYDVVGVDRSEPMLEQARERGRDATFVRGDVTTLELERTFDAAVLLFAVLGYQVETAQVLATLRQTRKHLRPGGLLAFDVWYGPAVLAERPTTRTKAVAQGERQLLRRSSGELDVRHHTVRVNFELTSADGGQEPLHESHLMRFFFPMELEHYLEDAGFELLRLGAFPDVDSDADESTWSVLAVARAV